MEIEIKDVSHEVNGYEFNLFELKVEALVGFSDSDKVDFLIKLSKKLGLKVKSITIKNQGNG